MKKTIFLFAFIFFTFVNGIGQTTQVVKGQILDIDSELPLIGATIQFLSENETIGSASDIDGKFILTGIPVGRQNFVVSYLGYEDQVVSNVLVGSGKEIILEIKMRESFETLDEVVISSKKDKTETINEMAAISARTFSLEEVTRYSGGRNDVSRLVSNYAGVSTADDSRNDIVIRGNSPTGVLWRLEGIPIPNPNHFATLGTTGGPVSALNTNLLKNSDFMTSAFTAEYGNALSGVFDLGFRKGNTDKYEGTFQIGAFSGIEAMVEGPINRSNNSSFVVSFRNSFAQFADELGIDIGTNATPIYRDLSFKADFGKSKMGHFSLFGILAQSDIDFLASETDMNDIFANSDEDSFAESKLGIVGIKHNYLLNDNSYIRTVISSTLSGNDFNSDRYLNEELSDKVSFVEVSDETTTQSISSFINTKHNKKFTSRFGFNVERKQLKSVAKDRDGRPDFDMDGIPDFGTFRDIDEDLYLFEGYFNNKYRISEKSTIHVGMHGLVLSTNQRANLEPRLAFTHQLKEDKSINFGYGFHSQMQSLPVFFYLNENMDGELEALNKDLGFTKAHHFVSGYEQRLSKDWRFKAETYFQYLFDVPVDRGSSTFSVLNAGADFVFPDVGQLENKGTGKNYGLELTLEKFFSKGYYGLLTTSVFDSKYTASDGVERNTAFNNRYVMNLLAGKEFKFGRDGKNAWTVDFKVTTAGGRYYTPVDLEKSEMYQTQVLQEDLAFTERYDPYFRVDLKLGVRLNNSSKFSQQFFIDFQNLTNRENIFVNRYNRETNSVNRVNQSGFLPDLLYRIQF